MFWRQARAKYGHLTVEDEDIKRYLQLTSNFQQESYQGIVGYINDIGHHWIAQHTTTGPILEIGFGIGRHSSFFKGNPTEYYISEYSAQNCRGETWQNFRGRATLCDARTLPYLSDTFKTVISIYNLEHIPDLAQVLSEVHRVLASEGHFLIALPCEGGLLWNVGREWTTRRYFQKRYGLNYDKIIAYEHVWDLSGVIATLQKTGLFHIKKQKMYPFRCSIPHLNLIACLSCQVLK